MCVLVLWYFAVAQQNFIQGGINRVILATDGDFNVGISNRNDLLKLIKQKKRSGVSLTILGFGMGNYNDDMLESISNAGDGNAAYIDTLQEAQKVLVNDIGATLQTIARDTKIQVEFNPDYVSSYRLIGYENRMLNQEDFINDRVDAGDVGAGHTVTALYEITLKQPLRYQTVEQSLPQFKNEIGLVKVRYKKINENNSRELIHIVRKGQDMDELKNSSDNFRFSAAVAAFGQLLRNSDRVGDYSYDEVYSLANKSRDADPFGYRTEFLRLVKLAASLN